MAVQPGLCRTWSETPKTGFLRTRLIYKGLASTAVIGVPLFILFITPAGAIRSRLNDQRAVMIMGEVSFLGRRLQRGPLSIFYLTQVLESALLIESILIFVHGASTCNQSLCQSTRFSFAQSLISGKQIAMYI